MPMTTTTTAKPVQFPEGATHVRQSIDGVSVVVAKRNFATINPDKPYTFGVWDSGARRFIEAAPTPPAQPIVVTAQGIRSADQPAAASPVAANERLATWGGRRRFIANLVIEGQLTARQIAEKVMEQFPGETTFEKALAHVRATPQHLSVIGIRARYRKESGTMSVNNQ